MTAPNERLFAPGDGALPPALAGREREQAVLSRCLGDLARGGAPPHNVVLVGPRGNGKTALLGWFAAACRRSRVNVVRVDPSRVRTEEALRYAWLPAVGLLCLLAAREALNRLGYIWCPPGQSPPVAWSAGIPSLMKYVQDVAST